MKLFPRLPVALRRTFRSCTRNRADPTHRNEKREMSRICARSARRLGDHFDCVDLWVVDHWNERKFDPSSRTRLNIVKCLYDGIGSALGKNIEVLQNHVAVAGDIKYPATRSPIHQIMFAKPRFSEMQCNAVHPQWRNGDVIAESPDSVRSEEHTSELQSLRH